MLKLLKRLISPYRNRRTARSTLLERMPSGAVCAEIGVWRGNFSRQLLEATRPAEVHLVDPWSYMPHLPLRGYGGRVAKSQDDMDAMARELAASFAGEPNVFIHRMTSAEFFRSTGTAFDLIYIDGDHRHEAVLADLTAAWSVLKPGGMLAGDDFRFNKTEERDMPVKRAVERFSRESGVPFELIGEQFYFRKPLG